MEFPFALILLALAVAPAALSQARPSRPAPPATPRVSPVPGPPPEAYGVLGFEIRLPNLTGALRLRFPETLNSSLGLHFIDHDRADMRPLSPMEPWPVWRTDRRTGEISYRVLTPEGVEFGGSARPVPGAVRLTFRVRNRTQEPITGVIPQMCYVLADAPAFSTRSDVSRTFVIVGGKPFALTGATPTPAEKQREPLMFVPIRGRPSPGEVGTDLGALWWIVDPPADTDLIYRVGADGLMLTAIEWPGQTNTVMVNSLIPCIHSGPSFSAAIAPGAEHVWRGTIHLRPNDPAALLAACARPPRGAAPR